MSTREKQKKLEFFVSIFEYARFMEFVRKHGSNASKEMRAAIRDRMAKEGE